MPTVPDSSGAVDPFNTKVKGKVQDRPPPSGPPPEMNPNPTETELLMAAATMHEMGRLFVPSLEGLNRTITSGK